jgi:uncharacterized membrane protein
MKRCPTCSRTYEDDSLIYCLDDGAPLVASRDPEATLIRSPPPVVLPPTLAYNEQPAPPPAPAPATQRGLRPLVLGALVVGVLLIGLLIGVWLSQRPDAPSSNIVAAATPTPARPTPTKPTPTPAPTIEKPTPTPTPTPSPLATASPARVESEPECMLYNDKADRSGVVTRSDCDTKDCDSDMDTKGDEYPDKTRVQVIKGSNVKGKRFTWVKVFLVKERLTVWVAASKIRC